MKSLASPAALLLGGFFAASAQAQTSSPTTVVVTATRSAQTTDDALASVTVISREEIERKQAQSVEQLLAQTPGVVVSNSGGRGKATSVFLRGTNSDHVLVLIDGIKVGSATLGTTSFEHLALDQVERIEIVRGPRSSLYGSEAIGGVIQIFTRKGVDGFKPRFSVEAGSHNSRDVRAGLSGGQGDAWYNFSVSDFSTDGFDAKRDTEPDADGYDNRGHALSGGYRFSAQAELALNWNRTEGDSEFDGSFQNASDNDLEVLGAKLSLKPLADWNLDLVLGRSLDSSTSYLDGTYVSTFETQRDTASLVSTHLLGTQSELNWGLDLQQDEVISDTAYRLTERDNLGVFGQYQLFLGPQDLAFSLRHDDNEQFGSRNTGSIAWGLELPRDLRLTASYGTAFKAPTFNDLYYPFGGNAELQPEESDTLELGLSGEHAGVHWSANLYQTEIENLIEWAPIAPGSWTWQPQNVSEARIRGLELIASTRLQQWDLAGSLDLLDPEDREDGSQLRRRARKMLNLSADRDYGPYSVGGSLLAVGKRPDGSEWLGGYGKLDLRAAYDLAPDWAVKARIENALDKSYQTASTYNQDGRTFWLSLHYAP